MKHLLVILGALGLVSCASSRVYRGGPHPDRLFPFGEYEHSVGVQTVEGKSFEFKGAVSLGPKESVWVGLSPIGTSLFRVRYLRDSKKMEIEIFHEPMVKHTEQLKAYLFTLLPLFDAKPGPRKRTFPGNKRQLEAEILAFDEYEIPSEVRVTDPKFQVLVKVRGYEIQ